MECDSVHFAHIRLIVDKADFSSFGGEFRCRIVLPIIDIFCVRLYCIWLLENWMKGVAVSRWASRRSLRDIEHGILIFFIQSCPAFTSNYRKPHFSTWLRHLWCKVAISRSSDYTNIFFLGAFGFVAGVSILSSCNAFLILPPGQYVTGTSFSLGMPSDRRNLIQQMKSDREPF